MTSDITLSVDLSNVDQRVFDRKAASRLRAKLREAAKDEFNNPTGVGGAVDWGKIHDYLGDRMPPVWVEVTDDTKHEVDVNQSIVLGVIVDPEADPPTYRDRKVNEMPNWHMRTVGGVDRWFFMMAEPRHPVAHPVGTRYALGEAAIAEATNASWADIIGISLPEAD